MGYEAAEVEPCDDATRVEIVLKLLQAFETMHRRAQDAHAVVDAVEVQRAQVL
ncbi:MAG: hypothetical protein RL701_5391 [Pseudomonadota bacterium]